MTVVHNPLGSGNSCRNGSAIVFAPRGASDPLDTIYVVEEYAGLAACEDLDRLEERFDDPRYYKGSLADGSAPSLSYALVDRGGNYILDREGNYIIADPT